MPNERPAVRRLTWTALAAAKANASFAPATAFFTGAPRRARPSSLRARVDLHASTTSKSAFSGIAVVHLMSRAARRRCHAHGQGCRSPKPGSVAGGSRRLHQPLQSGEASFWQRTCTIATLEWIFLDS